MERLLARLERSLGRFAIPNLITFIVGGMAIVWVLSTLRPEFQSRLVLDMGAVRHGEVWRLVTFLFIPRRATSIWLLVELYFTWWVGSSLEEAWGSFKFNVYYFVGVVATIAAAAFVGPVTNVWLNMSLFLAFATIFPDVTVLVAFIIPVRVKWLGILSACLMLFEASTGDWDARAAVAAALANYVLFFEGHWRAVWKQRGLIARQRVRREEMRPGGSVRPGSIRPGSVRPGSVRPPPPRDEDERDADGDGNRRRDSAAPVFGKRVCAMCGASEADGTDIRVCSCERCGGKPRTLCLAHARAH